MTWNWGAALARDWPPVHDGSVLATVGNAAETVWHIQARSSSAHTVAAVWHSAQRFHGMRLAPGQSAADSPQRLSEPADRPDAWVLSSRAA